MGGEGRKEVRREDGGGGKERGEEGGWRGREGER